MSKIDEFKAALRDDAEFQSVIKSIRSMIKVNPLPGIKLTDEDEKNFVGFVLELKDNKDFVEFVLGFGDKT